MKTRIIPSLLVVAHVVLAEREPMAFQMFDVAPSTSHPAMAADLAWLEGGRASACVSTRPEGEAAVSAPHFQVVYGRMRIDRVAPFQVDSVVDRTDRTRLRLGTAMALSQIGAGSGEPGAFDLALGVAFERSGTESKWSNLKGDRQWIDLSAAARVGGWRAGVVLADAVDVSSDSGVGSDRHLELLLGRRQDDGLAWGGGLDLPLETDGEAGLRLGISREFRDALVFQGELSTTYSNETDPESGADEFVRRSLDIRLGTRLKFRPWGAAEGDSWMRQFVDPHIRPGPDGFLLRGWEIGLSAGWDVVTGSAHPAIEIAKTF